MAKKICSCSNFLSCFSCFSTANNHHASLRVDTQTALSSSSGKEGTSSSGISAAVKQHDSQLPESASVGGSSSPSKVPSPPPSIPSEPARVGTIPTEKHDSQHPESASVGGSSSPSKVPSPPPFIPSEPARVGTIPTEVPKNEEVGEGCSYSSRNDDATLQTAPDLSSQIVKDVVGERVDLDGLIKHISQLLEIIEGKTSSPQRQRLAEDYFPTTSKIFTKLKKFLSQAKDVIPGEAIKTAVNVVLKGMGAPDLITTPFVLIANILERVGDVGDNEKECISLLKEMFFLAKLVKQFQEQHQLMETNGIIGVVKEAIELIVEGSILCCTQMQSSRFSKVSAASVNKEELSKFRQNLRDMYTRMNAQMGISLYDVNVPKKPRLSRGHPKHAVGIEEPVKEVLQLLDWESEEKAVAVMLHGFGGIGKTTLGDAVFSRANFEGCKYSEVRLFEDIKSQPDIIHLQKCILKDLMEHEETVPEIRKYEDGQRELGDILAKVPAFLYIDNVLGEKELEQLLPEDVNESKKLRLLFTARDQDVRRAFPGKTCHKIYDMKTISNSTAMSFFYDMEERLNPSQINDLINICGGVPLMLKLVGKVLSSEEDKQKAYYKVMQHKQNVNALTYRGPREEYFFAYDYLLDECKDPFHDVCFFFKGWDWDTVADIVGEDQLDILEKGALVTKGIDSAASVHDIILTIGYQKAEGTRFKFTSASQFDEFLDRYEEKDIKGIWFGENKDPCIISGSKLESMCKSLRVVDLGNLTKVEGQCNKIFENLVYFQGGITQLPFDVSKIKNLRYLKYEPQDLALPKMPSSLRHMEFNGRLQSPACEISSICQQQLGNLRVLRLVEFAELKNSPERIGDQLKALQELSLSHCSSLTELPDWFCNLSFITRLHLLGCTSLHRLPTRFGELASLRRLLLNRCRSLERLPESFGQLRCLETLAMPGCTSLEELCNDFHCLTSLQFLNLSGCESLKKLPEDFHCLASLQKLKLSFCDMLEGKSMDNVLKIKTLNVVNIEGSGMLVDRWAEIQRESDQSSSFQEKVYTGQAIYRENMERKILSQLEFLFSEGREKPFHPSVPLLLVVFDRFNDFNNNFPWPLIEETIDDIQINFEMLYIGRHFDKLPPKAKNIIVGHVDDPDKPEVVNLKRTMQDILSGLAGVQYLIQMTMVEDGRGGKCRPCWKPLTEREMEEFLLCSCGKYLQLKQLAETRQLESSTKLLRELFAAGEAQTCTFIKAPSGSSKPLSCTAEDLKGKTILLEIRALHVGYDLRLASLIQLYNTKKETFNLEIISIPLVDRRTRSRIDALEQFSREIPWLVIQNPWAIPIAVKYFLMNLCAPHEREADSPFDIKIIESNGRIFTSSKPVMGLLDRWGAKAYPFTLQKIEELKKEEWNQMETIPTLEFLFNELESVSHQVKEMMLQRKVVCLYGGSESDQNTMKEFTGLMRDAFISLSDNVHIIYIPSFKFKAWETWITTDAGRSYSYQPLEMSRLAQAEMEGMLLLNLSQPDAFRFWRRLALLKEEISEMTYNRDTEQLSTMKMLFQCWDNENPWMILMDEEGKTITESGRKLVLSWRGSMEDEAKALIELLVKGSKEQRKEALLKSEQWLKSEQLPCRLGQERTLSD